ncbi:Na+/H+ antiporter subunit E [bacterium]|nr:Na+/H+ antiporter subunit E [bacterium]
MRKIVLILFAFILWVLLTWSFTLQSLTAGGVVALIIGLLFGNFVIEKAGPVFDLRRWFWALVYIPVFLWEMTKANFDVAYRVLHPKLPIDPGIVKVKTKLQSEMGIVFLANSITLTPGTFTVDLKGQYLYIHCIKVRSTGLAEASHEIVDRFEKLLIKIFD